MEKMHVFLLLLTHLISTRCMESELRCRKPNSTHQIVSHTTLEHKKTELEKINSMQQLYKDAYTFMHYARDRTLNSHYYNKKSNFKYLTLLVKDMHNMQKTNTNEDVMARYAYNKWYNSYSIDPVPTYIPLLFGCLKKYRLQANKKKEELPLDTTSYLNTFPNYYMLLYSINLLSLYHDKEVKMLASCLYSDTKIMFENCSQGSYENLEDEFYAKAYDVLKYPMMDKEKYYTQLYDLLQIIEKSKNLHAIHDEQDLGYKLLNKTTTSSFFGPSLSQDITNLMSYCCIVIQRYNKDRDQKTTPTDKQYDCYCIKNHINIALPDSFDNSLFDKHLYAFENFTALINRIIAIKKYNPHLIQEKIAKHYPLRK